MSLAGTPPTKVFSRTSRVTTAPAAITAPRPTVTPGRTVTFDPNPDPILEGDRAKCEGAAPLFGGADFMIDGEQGNPVPQMNSATDGDFGTRDRREAAR